MKAFISYIVHKHKTVWHISGLLGSSETFMELIARNNFKYEFTSFTVKILKCVVSGTVYETKSSIDIMKSDLITGKWVSSSINSSDILLRTAGIFFLKEFRT